MIDLTVRPETIKLLLKDNKGKNPFDISLSNMFLDMSPNAQEMKAKLNYWDYIKIKSSCIQKKTINKTERQPTEREKIFANDISNKGLILKIYKELKHFKSKNPQIIHIKNEERT